MQALVDGAWFDVNIKDEVFIDTIFRPLANKGMIDQLLLYSLIDRIGFRKPIDSKCSKLNLLTLLTIAKAYLCYIQNHHKYVYLEFYNTETNELPLATLAVINKHEVQLVMANKSILLHNYLQ